MALFIHKAAQARIEADRKAPLVEIDPRSGWLTDLTNKLLGNPRCAAFEQYQGDRTESSRVTFMAYSEGDDRYRYTEHVGMLPRGFKSFASSKEQTITFPALDRIRTGNDSVALHATNDWGLPVEYHIAYGQGLNAIVSVGRQQTRCDGEKIAFELELTSHVLYCSRSQRMVTRKGERKRALAKYPASLTLRVFIS